MSASTAHPQTDLFSERVPPHSLEAEQSVLGAMLIDREAVAKVAHLLRAEDFYADKHSQLFDAFIAVFNRKEPVDLVTAQDELRKRGQLEAIGNLTYLTNLMNVVPTTANAAQYAEIVATKARLRNIQAAARRTVEACYNADSPIEVLSGLQKAIDKEGRRGTRRGLRPIAGRIGPYAAQRYEHRHLPNADWIPSRFPLLREKCPYLRREVTLLAMPPASGKTTLAVGEAMFLAQVGYKVAFFELEMGEGQIYDKFIGLSARLDVQSIRMGVLTELDWLIYNEHGQKLNAMANLSINNETAETMSNIFWQCLRMKADTGLDMVIIDFLERVTETTEKGERYDQLLARIAGLGQRIARECNCHVMILVQIDVRALDRLNPIPTKSDLANSKTNLAAWPDNIITGIQPSQAKGDGKTKPKIGKVECTDKRWRNTMVLSVAKGRFSEAGALVPIYAELNTGYLGSLRRPWPWQIKCIPLGSDTPHASGEKCPDGDLCKYNQVGLWDKEADDQHMAAMVKFRASAMAAEAQDEW